jgi:DNA-binding ferritin-like protein
MIWGKTGMVSAQFLYFHFMTEEGLQQIRETSSGSADRNRMLGLKASDGFQVPASDYKFRCWIDEISQRLEDVCKEQAEVLSEVYALIPSVLDRAF